MMRRTVLLLIALLSCWTAQAAAQSIETTTGTLTDATSPVTEEVTSATQKLEPVKNQVSSTADSASSQLLGSGGSSGGGSSGGSSGGGSSGGSTGSGGGTTGDGTTGGGPSSSGGTTSSGGADSSRRDSAQRNRADAAGGGGGGFLGGPGSFAPYGPLAAGREPALPSGVPPVGGGVLSELAGGADLEKLAPNPPVPESPAEFPSWIGLGLVIVLGVGFAGMLAAITRHVLGGARSS